MIIRIQPNDRGNPAGKLANVELHFEDGPLRGLRLVGFEVWERRTGGRNVTFPARQYSVNGSRRSFALLRPVADTADNALRDRILAAFAEHEASTVVESEAEAMTHNQDAPGFTARDSLRTRRKRGL